MHSRLFVILFAILVLAASCDKNEDKDPGTTGKWEQVYKFFPGLQDRFKPLYMGMKDTLIYGLGEYPLATDGLFPDLWSYTKKGWGKIADFPGKKRMGESVLLFFLEDQMYVGLGESFDPEACKDLWKYDLKNHTWDSLEFQFPGESRFGALFFKSEGVIHYGAGVNGKEGMLNKMYTFHPERGWEVANPAYIDRQAYSTTFALNGEVYDCFGQKEGNEYLSTIRKFNTGQKRWEPVYVIKTEDERKALVRIQAKAFVIPGEDGEYAYIIGGKPAPGVTTEEFWICCRYNPRTNEIVKINPPDVKSIEAAFSIDHEGYIFDGTNIWKFIP